MSLPRMTIFSMKGCPHCSTAKGFLSKASVPFTVIDINCFERRYATAVADSGQQTVPVIYVGQVLVGGRSDLEGIAGDKTEREAVEKTLIEYHRRKLEASGTAIDSDLPEFLQPFSDAEEAMWKEFQANSVDSSKLTSRLHEPEFKIPGLSGSGRTIAFKELHEKLHGKEGVEVKDRGFMWCKKRTFIAKELVGVVRRDVCGTTASDEDAVELCRELQARHMIEPYKHSHDITFKVDDELWRFVADHGSHSMNRNRIFEVAPANDDGSSSLPKARNGSDVAHDLRVWLGLIIEKFITPDGVAYHKMQDDEDFRKFTEATTELQVVDLEELSRAEKIAFGINTYNMAVLHAYAIRGPPSGYFDMYRFFNSIGYDIGGHHYTLNEIENGFLRGNRKSIGAFSVPFDAKDPRLKHAVENPDYRIHFALNCGAKSCPPIKVFTAPNLDEGLQKAANAFMSSATFDADKKTLKVSKIISWYHEDFTTPTMGPVELCVKHLPKDMADECREVGLDAIKLDFAEYDWSTNAVPKSKR